MYKVLVVDDEELICKGIHSMIHRMQYAEIHAVELAYDPMEAQALVEKEPPDIIIADIRMPHKNGIEMIKEILAERPHIQCMILSGYDEFEYTREAFKAGVVDFLLKPVSFHELQSILEKAMRQLNVLRQERESSRIDQFIRDQQELHMLFHKLIHLDDGSGLHQEDELAALLRPYFPYDGMTVGIVQFNGCDILQMERIVSHIQLHVNMYCSMKYQAVIYGFILNNEDAVLVMNYSSSATDFVRDYLLELKTIMLEYGDMEYTVGVSQAFRHSTSLLKAFHQAEKALSYRLLVGSGKTIRYDEIQGRDEDIGFLGRILTELKEHSEHLVYEAYSNAVDVIFSLEQLERLSIDSVMTLYMRVLGFLKKAAAERGQLTDHFDRAFTDFRSLRDIRIYLKDGMLQLIRTSSCAPRVLTIGDLAKNYVKEHYKKEVDMAVVANSVGVSYTYFSKLFKDETGRTFSEYVMEVRMEEAMRQLNDPTAQIQEIASNVGYVNPKHFSRAFKRFYGISPMDYRRRFSARSTDPVRPQNEKNRQDGVQR